VSVVVKLATMEMQLLIILGETNAPSIFVKNILQRNEGMEFIANIIKRRK